MNGFRVGEISGIEIRINWSVLVIGALVAASLAESILPEIAEGYSTGAYWFAGVTATLAFFAGLLAHELGHSIVALSEDVEVSSITLWLFGGVAALASPPPTPQASIRIAAAGPAVSAIIGLSGLLLGALLSGLVGATLLWFGLINLGLAVFNLLPAYPMDGGRLYHAWLWARTGDSVAATERAAKLGAGIGAGLVALGLLQVLVGGFAGGLWLMMIGVFVREAARAELRQRRLEGPMRSTKMADLMTPFPETVQPSMSVEAFVGQFLTESRHVSYPVVDGTNRPIGLVTMAAVRDVPRDSWGTVEVGAIARPQPQLLIVDADAALVDVLPARGLDAGERILVVEDERLVGIVAPSDIARWVSVLDVVGDRSSTA